MRGDILIVFPDLHLPYSPSTLRLYEALIDAGYRVKLIAPEPEAQYSSLKVDLEGVRYFNQYVCDYGFVKRSLLRVTENLLGKRLPVKCKLMTGRAKCFINQIKKFKGTDIIAVDFFSLWCVHQTGRDAHLLSLEILENDVYYQNCDFNRIRSVLIQSQVRYDYLFTGYKPKCFFFVNAPSFIDIEPRYDSRSPYELIYCGTAVISFGIISILDFLVDYPEYSLTVKGNVPRETEVVIEHHYFELVRSGRLRVDSTYVSPSELTEYVSRFRIGFAFYDFYRFMHLRKFNYFTAPSGKLFQYLNAGVPVVGNILEGFSFVESEQVGALIGQLSSGSIKKAIDNIEADYFGTAVRAYNLARRLDTGPALETYIREVF